MPSDIVQIVEAAGYSQPLAWAVLAPLALLRTGAIIESITPHGTGGNVTTGNDAKPGGESEEYKARLTDWLNERAHCRAWALEQYRTVAQFASVAIRAGFLINGGALVALLAFLGNVTKEAGGAVTAGRFGGALGLFVAGLVASAVGAAFAYASVYMKAVEVPDSPPGPGEKRKLLSPPASWGAAYHRLTVAALVASLLFFVIGAVKAFVALTH